MIHKIIISDRSFNVKEEITNTASSIRWGYNRIGGCAGFSFSVPTRYCQETALGGNYNVKMYSQSSAGNYDLIYQGRIESKNNEVKGNVETISIKGSGYQSELKDIYIDADYTNKTIEYIVDDIMTTVAANTNIIKGTIAATGFTADSLEFNTDALSALQTCADIVGSREWGVDASRTFYFKERSSTVGFRYPFGNKLYKFTLDNSSQDIVNRAIVIGGDVSGTTFKRIVNDTTSQLKWGRRDRVIQNSSIVTNAVADQFASATFAEFSNVVMRGKVMIVDDVRIEDVIPIPLFMVLSETKKYGTMKYGTGLYAANEGLQVNRISYVLNDDGWLQVTLDLGVLRPDIAESISKLEFKIDQLTAQGV